MSIEVLLDLEKKDEVCRDFFKRGEDGVWCASPEFVQWLIDAGEDEFLP